MKWMMILLPLAMIGGWTMAIVAPELTRALIPWGFGVGTVMLVLGVVLDRPSVRRRLGMTRP